MSDEPIPEEQAEEVVPEPVVVVPTDLRVTHVGMTEAEELAAAEPPPDTSGGGLSSDTYR